MSELIVYSRRGCHLCEDLIDELLPLIRDRAELVVRDVDTRPDWARAYGLRVPVVEAGGEVLCEFHLDRERVLRHLRDRGESRED